MYKGILYVASNEIIQEAIISARQIRNQMDNPNITVITDELKSENDCFDKVIVEENFHSDWRVKPEKIPNSPYDRTIYLDSDTYVTEDISDMYNILNEFDIAVSREPMGITRTVDELPRAFPEFNTGIMLFENNENTRSLFDTWRKIYQDRQERMDQPSFRKALYESDVAFTSLPPEYNCRWSVAGVVSDEVKIFHGRLIDLSKNISGLETEINISNAIDKINSRIDTRVFVNQSGDLQCFVREG